MPTLPRSAALALVLAAVALAGAPAVGAPATRTPATRPADPLRLPLPDQEPTGSEPTAAAPADSTILVPEDRAAADRAAAEQLRALFERMAGLESVTVAVDAGLASLRGTVASPDARERAADIARRVEGVAFVDNRIEVTATLEERLDPAWSRLRTRMGELAVYLPLLGVAIVVFVLAILLALWVGRVDVLYDRLGSNVFVRNVVRQVIRAVIVLLGLAMAVEILDVTALVGAVVGTAGLAGIILGFAFKDIVENYLAGLILSLRQPFLPNDTVVIEGREGKVVRLTSRETILMSLDGNHIRIPNATVFRSVVVNYTRNPLRRFEIQLTAAPEADFKAAMAAGVAVLLDMPGVLDDPPPMGRVMDVGDSLVTLSFFGWVDQEQADFLKVRSEAVRLLLAGLTEAGVDMPPPEQRVRFRREDGGPAPRAPAPAADPVVDVAPDRHLDDQIEDDRRASDEEDLLTPS